MEENKKTKGYNKKDNNIYIYLSLFFNKILSIIKTFLLYCFNEATLVCLFLTMLIFTIATKDHIDFIINITAPSIGFPMFAFIFLSVINFLAALAYKKKRTLMTFIIITLLSTLLIFFCLYYINLGKSDQYYESSIELANKSFMILYIGMALTVLAFVMGIVNAIRNRFNVDKKMRLKVPVNERNSDD